MKGLSSPGAHNARASALLLASAVWLGGAGLCQAAPTPQPVGLSGLLQGAQGAASQITGHYISETGPGFVFDLSAPRPLLRFDGAVEIWVLSPSQGPRGDTLYKNDMGETMLRVARIGGMTVYPPHNDKGMAASFEQPDNPLGLRLMLNAAAYQIGVDSAAGRLQRAIPSMKGFDVAAHDIPAEKVTQWSGIIVDAAAVLAEAAARLSGDPKMRKALAKVTYVQLSLGDAPSAKLDKGRLLIVIAPLQGMAGRPSSEKIEAALGVR